AGFGTMENNPLSPFAIVGCARMASRRTVEGNPASMAVSTTVTISPLATHQHSSIAWMSGFLSFASNGKLKSDSGKDLPLRRSKTSLVHRVLRFGIDIHDDPIRQG